jgi:hypothetical protein
MLNIQNYESILDIFLDEIDKAITSGNITYVKTAIKKYENFIDKSYILWANSIALELVEEKLETLIL